MENIDCGASELKLGSKLVREAIAETKMLIMAKMVEELAKTGKPIPTNATVTIGCWLLPVMNEMKLWERLSGISMDEQWQVFKAGFDITEKVINNEHVSNRN